MALSRPHFCAQITQIELTFWRKYGIIAQKEQSIDKVSEERGLNQK